MNIKTIRFYKERQLERNLQKTHLRNIVQNKHWCKMIYKAFSVCVLMLCRFSLANANQLNRWSNQGQTEHLSILHLAFKTARLQFNCVILNTIMGLL